MVPYPRASGGVPLVFCFACSVIPYASDSHVITGTAYHASRRHSFVFSPFLDASDSNDY